MVTSTMEATGPSSITWQRGSHEQSPGHAQLYQTPSRMYGVQRPPFQADPIQVRAPVPHGVDRHGRTVTSHSPNWRPVAAQTTVVAHSIAAIRSASGAASHASSSQHAGTGSGSVIQGHRLMD